MSSFYCVSQIQYWKWWWCTCTSTGTIESSVSWTILRDLKWESLSGLKRTLMKKMGTWLPFFFRWHWVCSREFQCCTLPGNIRIFMTGERLIACIFFIGGCIRQSPHMNNICTYDKNQSECALRLHRHYWQGVVSMMHTITYLGR